MRKEDEIEDSTKRLEMIVRGMVKKQALDIIKKEKKKYNHYPIHSFLKNVIIKDDLTLIYLHKPTAIFYRKEKLRLQKKLKRLEVNKTILVLKETYPLIDIEQVAYYLSMNELLSFKTPNHYNLLEKVVRVVLGLESSLECLKYKNYKYIKLIQSKYDFFDVSVLAEHINSFTGFEFKKREEYEHLDCIIKLILSIPIAIVNRVKLKDWQVEISINMKQKEENIRSLINKNKEENK